MSKTVPFRIIQFSISTQFKFKYTVYLSKTFLFQAILFSQIVLIQTIQFSVSMQLVLFNPIRCYHTGTEWTWEQWQWRGTLYSPKLQHHWSLTIRSFSVISRTLQRCSRWILQPQPTGQCMSSLSYLYGLCDGEVSGHITVVLWGAAFIQNSMLHPCLAPI